MGKFVMKKAKTGFMFNLKARNGQVIGTSEIYSGEAACRNGIEAVRKAVESAKLEDQTKAGSTPLTNPKFEIYKDARGEFRFRLKAKNGEIILTGEGYASKDGCRNGIASICTNAPDAIVVEE